MLLILLESAMPVLNMNMTRMHNTSHVFQCKLAASCYIFILSHHIYK